MAYNNDQLVTLRAELDAGHPNTGAYDADPQIAANQLNETNRPGDGDPNELIRYVWLERHRENTGTDLNNSYIYGRIRHMADQGVGSNPFGADPAISLTLDQLASACTFLNIIEGIQNNVPVSLGDDRLRNMLADLRDSGAMNNGDRSAILALADNELSRVQELGLPRVRAADVAAARALP